MPVGVVVARVAGDNALSGSGLLTPNEAGRMLGIFDVLAPVMLACVDSFDKLSGGHSKEVPARVGTRRSRCGRKAPEVSIVAAKSGVLRTDASTHGGAVMVKEEVRTCAVHSNSFWHPR